MSMIGGVVEKRHTLPILGNCLLQLQGGRLTVTATDLEVEIRTTTAVDAEGEGEVTLPAKKLADICRALPEGVTMDIRIEGDKAVIRAARSRFSLGVLPAADYPAIEMAPAEIRFDVKEGELRALLDRTAFSMAQQDVRYYLNGLLLELGPTRVRAVATDGHRLALCELAKGLVEEPRQVLLPRKAVLELARLLDYSDETVKVEVSSGFARFVRGDWVFTSKLIDGRFPDYERVIPRNLDKTAVLDREGLRKALARASILSSEKYKGIRLTFAGQVLKLQAHNPEQEEAEEEVEMEYGEAEVTIGFNVGYLGEILGAINSEKVAVDLLSGSSSAILRDPGDATRLYVVMPMRL